MSRLKFKIDFDYLHQRQRTTRMNLYFSVLKEYAIHFSNLFRSKQQNDRVIMIESFF
jgi:hypothetical protein